MIDYKTFSLHIFKLNLLLYGDFRKIYKLTNKNAKWKSNSIIVLWIDWKLTITFSLISFSEQIIINEDSTQNM